MENILKKVMYEDFNGLPSFADNIQNIGGTQKLDIMSRYSGFAQDHDAIKNFDKLNMLLSPLYATRNSSGQSLYWSADDITKNYNRARGAFDRYFWSGAIQQTGNSSVFKSTRINSISTDGYAMIPSPYADFAPGVHKTVNGNEEQDSIKVRLRFNNLPKNKFVPLFGYAYSHTGKSDDIENSHGVAYKPRYEHSHQNMYYGYQAPFQPKVLKYPKNANYQLAASADKTNLYEASTNESPYQGDYVRNSILWFLYAHDGNGNGMIATCAGDAETSDPTGSIYRPTNEHFGATNGFSKFKAPHVIQNYLDEGGSLRELWYHYNTGGAGKADYTAEDKRGAFNSVHYYSNENPHPFPSRYPKAFPVQNYKIGSYPEIKFAGTNVHEGGLSGRAKWSSYGWYPGAINHSHLQLVSYGSVGSNADLKNFEDLYINVNTISSLGKGFDEFGIDSRSTPSNHHAACQLMYTGKLMGFTFKDVPGQMYWDNIQWAYQYDYYHTKTYHRVKVSNEPMGYGPGALVLRPTVEGDAEIDSFSIAKYPSSPGEVFGGTTLLKDNVRSAKTNRYYFSSDGVSYNPLGEVESGTKSPEDPTLAWDAPANMFDLDRTTASSLLMASSDNALYAPFNGSHVFTDIGNEENYILNEFSLNINGVTLIDYKDHKLRFVITDNTKNKVLFESGTTENPDVVSVSGKTVPMADGSFILYFSPTNPNVTYKDVKDGFLKIWAEEL
jgi:hypothetical protein